MIVNDKNQVFHNKQKLDVTCSAVLTVAHYCDNFATQAPVNGNNVAATNDPYVSLLVLADGASTLSGGRCPQTQLRDTLFRFLPQCPQWR